MRVVARALSDGIRRVLSAPVVLAAAAALSISSPLYPNAASRRILIEFVVVGSFLCGGIIDRYARDRPTRADGFFGACGHYFSAMLRLAAAEVLLYLGADNIPDVRAAIAAAIVINLVMVYARVRLVIEDRRSAIGAIAAAMRFLRRNLVSAPAVYAVWMAAMVGVAFAARGAAPILILPLLASATALFQARLAHAGYTAAPPLEWPDSPAAEGITNRTP